MEFGSYEETTIKVATMSFIFYVTLNLVIPHIVKPPVPKTFDYPEEKYLYYATYASFINSMIIPILGIYIIYYYGNGICGENLPIYGIPLGLDLGYIIQETIYGELFKYNEFAMRFHHFAVILGQFNILFWAKIGASADALCLAEISGPPLQIRIIMDKTDRSKGLFYTINDASLMVTFTVMRLFVGYPLVYQIANCEGIAIFLLFGTSIVMIMSSFYLNKIHYITSNYLITWFPKNKLLKCYAYVFRKLWMTIWGQIFVTATTAIFAMIIPLYIHIHNSEQINLFPGVVLTKPFF